jgi:hypothetical protein
MSVCWRTFVAIGVLITAAIAAGCSSDDPSTDVATQPPFIIASGEDGIALTNGDWFESVEIDMVSVWPQAALLPDGAAAVVGNGLVAVLRPHMPAVTAPCDSCSGVAVAGDEIVTTRRSLQPGNGFDIMFFGHDLASSRSAAAQRLVERVSPGYPEENTASPVTLAATSDSVTVAYLAADGGVRGGPSIVATYSLDGELRLWTKLDGRLEAASVSPDGKFLALGMGGSGGVCILSSSLVVLTMDRLEQADLGTAVPEFAVSTDGVSYIHDLVWHDGVVTATSLVQRFRCDTQPVYWARTVNPVTWDVIDELVPDTATRWVGPACDDLLVLRASGNELGWPDGELFRRSGGTEQRLGSYNRVALGTVRSESCP